MNGSLFAMLLYLVLRGHMRFRFNSIQLPFVLGVLRGQLAEFLAGRHQMRFQFCECLLHRTPS